VFNDDELKAFNEGFKELNKLLRPGESTKEIREWHEGSRFLYDICVTPKILDYVEDLLGPNYFFWASNFFAKPPRSKEKVGWHQDAYYWPLSPHHTVTVWIAFTDSNKNNGAMQVIPASHKSGIIKHQRYSETETDSVLVLELEDKYFAADKAVALELEAGEISIHDDRIVHGSPENPSDQWRIGLTVRYSGTDVKCDLTINPHFKAFLVRGIDEYKLNPQGEIPNSQYGRLFRAHRSIEEAGQDDWHSAGNL
jgi:non-heme Fe2+,alpha-ketoglutarate-dependent halogenase